MRGLSIDDTNIVVRYQSWSSNGAETRRSLTNAIVQVSFDTANHINKVSDDKLLSFAAWLLTIARSGSDDSALSSFVVGAQAAWLGQGAYVLARVATMFKVMFHQRSREHNEDHSDVLKTI